MKNQFRPLLALLVILPLAIILTLQTIATPRGEADEGIERRRRLLEQQAEKLERAIESSIETKGPEADKVRRNLHYQRKAIGQKLAELDVLAESEDQQDERRRDRDEDDEDEDDERRRDRDEDEDDERRRDRDEDDERRRRDRDEDDEDEDDERRWLNSGTEEKILDALDDETVMEFFDVTLKQMVDQIADRHKIPIWIDEIALDEVGLGTDSAINSNLRGISLRSGLRLALSSLGQPLSYVIKDEVLKITTPEQVEAELISRIYPLGDLILPRDEYEASFATRIGAAVAAGRISREEAGKIFERNDRQEKHPQRNLHGDEQDREEHLQAAIEHLQGAGFSARTARHVIAEAMRLEDQGDDHHEVERRRHADEDERHHREREGDDEDEFHDRAHPKTATQLEALRREVAELRELVEKTRNRR